jgi:hypothetical protein
MNAMNRPIIFIIFIFLISSQLCFSQYHWEWARGATSNADPTAEGIQVALDSSENLYFGGFYGYNISFGAYTLNGGVSCFLAKYDSSGNVLWAVGDSVAGTSLDESGIYGVCTDAVGNCYVTGGFRDTVFFGSFRLIANQYSNSFLVKYDPNGNVIWAKASLNTMLSDFAFGVSANLSGVYITGHFNNSISFDTCSLTGSGDINVFVAKFDSAGNAQWIRGSQGVYQYSSGYGIATDHNGNVYITGAFDVPSISFGTHVLFNTSAQYEDAFIVKYDSAGNVLWAQSQGSIGPDASWAVACDPSDNVIQAGYYFIDSAFIIKYNPAGTRLWSKNIVGNSGGQVNCEQVTTDNQSNVYATGGFWNTPVNIGGDTIINQPPFASDPVFIVKYDLNGNLLFATALTNGGDDQCGIAVAKSGNIYIGGDYSDTIFVVGNDTLRSPANIIEQAFVAKLACEFQTGFTALNSFCPGTCIDFLNLSTGAISYQWSFPGASPDSSVAINPTNICFANPGTYDVQLIGFNTNGSDTLLLTNYITVFPSPPPQSISQNGDTLFAIAGSSSYQWYYNGNLITGATDYFYIAAASGDYNVIVADTNGCEVEAVINNVIANSSPLSFADELGVKIYPNPVETELKISNTELKINSAEIKVYNLLDILAVQCQILNAGSEIKVDVSALASGLYQIEIFANEKIFRSKFVKR